MIPVLHNPGIIARKKSLVIDANDNFIAHGTGYNAWTIDAVGSSSGISGIVLSNNTNNFAYIDINGTSGGQPYWGSITINAKTGTTGNIVIPGVSGAQGCSFGSDGFDGTVVGSAVTIVIPALSVASPVSSGSDVGTSVVYFKIQPSGIGPHRIVLTHIGGVAGATMRVIDFKIYPIPEVEYLLVGRGDQYGNIQTSPINWAQNCIDAILAVNPHGVIHVGDTSDVGVPPSVWQNTIQNNINGKVPYGMVATWGNHDHDSDPTGAAFRTFYNTGATNYYTKSFPPTGNSYIQVFSYDNYTVANVPATNPQLTTAGAWMTGAIANSNAIWKIVLFHYPAYTSGQVQTANGTPMQSSVGWNWSSKNVPLVMCGHNHQVERIHQDGLVSMNIAKCGQDTHAWSTISAGSKFRSGATANIAVGQGYLKMSVTAGSLTLEYFSIFSTDANINSRIVMSNPNTHVLMDRVKIMWV
jgi:hypothetical protein